MEYRDDRHGPKLLFLAFLVVGVYLAFFNFDIRAAYEYTVAQVGGFFSLFGL